MDTTVQCSGVLSVSYQDVDVSTLTYSPQRLEKAFQLAELAPGTDSRIRLQINSGASGGQVALLELSDGCGMRVRVPLFFATE